MNCKNCDAVVDGKFCSSCGQSAHIHRVTIGHLVHEFFHVMTHADKGIIFLVKQLLVRPGFVVKEYLEGKRKKYFNPVSFLLITTAIGALIAYKSGYYEALGKPASRQPQQISRYYQETLDITVHYGKVLGLFLIVPLCAFLSRIFFWRPRYNFAEHIVLQSYCLGLFYIVQSFIFVPLFLVSPSTAEINNVLLQLVYAIYTSIVYKQLFSKNLFVSILKAFIIVFLFITLFWTLIFAYVLTKHFLFG